MQDSQGTSLVPVESIPTPDPGVDPKVQKLYQAGVRLLQYADARVILDNKDVERATEDLIVGKNSMEAIEVLRVQYVKPHNDRVKEVNDAFRTFVAPMQQAKAINLEKVKGHRDEERRKIAAQEEINRLRTEAAQREAALTGGELSEPVGLIPVQQEPPKLYRTGVGTLGGRKRWEWKVVDFAALPDAFKVEAPATIRAALQAGKTIPGIDAEQVEDVAVKRTPAEPAKPPERHAPPMERPEVDHA